jgi:hypothetical protein
MVWDMYETGCRSASDAGEAQAQYAAASLEVLYGVKTIRPEWCGIASHTGAQIIGSQAPGPKRYAAISCRSCGAPVTSIEPACTYCLTER